MQGHIQWLNYSAIGGGSLQVRGFEGLKLEPEGPRAELGFLTADHGFSSIQGTLFGFVAFKQRLNLQLGMLKPFIFRNR